MKHFFILLLILSALFFQRQAALAAMGSNNYTIQADTIDIGGVRQSSDHYFSQDSIGEMGTGVSQSPSFMLDIGFWPMVGDEPVLVFDVTDGVADLGTLDISNVHFDTAKFNAATSAKSGYSIQFYGNPLSTDAHIINPLSGGGISDPGTEQFGFNLVANAPPIGGMNPVGGNGQAYIGYNAANSFKFSSGDTIAQSTSQSDFTDFTISFISNISNVSNAGNYSTDLTIVVTGRY
jgi:hypothetical protein